MEREREGVIRCRAASERGVRDVVSEVALHGIFHVCVADSRVGLPKTKNNLP